MRQSEVEHLRGSSLGEEDVGGLDVAMRNALRVRGFECFGDLDSEPEQVVGTKGRSAMRCLSVMPSRYSMTMQARPFCSPMSWMVQMFGWFKADAARASRSNRRSA